ncbi:TPA: hypothetical protein ACTADN_001894 [Salmonella enterica subsp. enterica serovar Birkenhead]
MRKFVKNAVTSAIVVGLSASSAFALDGAAAAGVDYSNMTAAFDFGTTVAAVMAVAAGACGLMLAMVGAKKVFQFIRQI